MTRNHQPVTGVTIAQGGVALMLCEAILHVLIQERLLRKEQAIEAIDSVVETIGGLSERETGALRRPHERRAVAEYQAILDSMRSSFYARD
jgi:hypothetical protein